MRFYIPLLFALVTAACTSAPTETDPAAATPDGGNSPSGAVLPVQPIGSALGPHPATPTWAVMIADVRIKMSDGSWCRDKSQKDARWNAGVYTGTFGNCPGMSYDLVVTKPANAGLVLVTTYVMNAALDYRMDITMPDGSVHVDVPKLW